MPRLFIAPFFGGVHGVQGQTKVSRWRHGSNSQPVVSGLPTKADVAAQNLVPNHDSRRNRTCLSHTSQVIPSLPRG
jgi:hypothetical protein